VHTPHDSAWVVSAGNLATAAVIVGSSSLI